MVIASATETFFVGALLLTGLFVAVGAVGGLLVWRTLRRRWRLVAGHAAVRTVATAWSLAGTSGRRPFGRSGAGAGGRGAQRSRTEMRHAVDAADVAVREADQAGASVGDLPALCRRLRTASDDVDRLLLMGGDLRGSGARLDLERQVAEVLSASASIRLAAVTAASDASAPRVTELASDADREMQCIAAGLASARASLPHQRA